MVMPSPSTSRTHVLSLYRSVLRYLSSLEHTDKTYVQKRVRAEFEKERRSHRETQAAVKKAEAMLKRRALV